MEMLKPNSSIIPSSEDSTLLTHVIRFSGGDAPHWQIHLGIFDLSFKLLVLFDVRIQAQVWSATFVFGQTCLY